MFLESCMHLTKNPQRFFFFLIAFGKKNFTKNCHGPVITDICNLVDLFLTPVKPISS